MWWMLFVFGQHDCQQVHITAEECLFFYSESDNLWNVDLTDSCLKRKMSFVREIKMFNKIWRSKNRFINQILNIVLTRVFKKN